MADASSPDSCSECLRAQPETLSSSTVVVVIPVPAATSRHDANQSTSGGGAAPEVAEQARCMPLPSRGRWCLAGAKRRGVGELTCIGPDKEPAPVRGRVEQEAQQCEHEQKHMRVPGHHHPPPLSSRDALSWDRREGASGRKRGRPRQHPLSRAVDGIHPRHTVASSSPLFILHPEWRAAVVAEAEPVTRAPVSRLESMMSKRWNDDVVLRLFFKVTVGLCHLCSDQWQMSKVSHVIMLYRNCVIQSGSLAMANIGVVIITKDSVLLPFS
jgi:hypothetical protein